MKRFRLLVSVGCVFAAAVTWWMWPAVSNNRWKMSESNEVPIEWDIDESRAHYAVPKDGLGKAFLVVNGVMLKNETPLSLKEELSLDNDQAWVMMTA